MFPRNRRQALDRFCVEVKVGKLPYPNLTADHLESWVKRQGWSPSMRRSAINYVTSAFNHCVKRRKISASPIHGVARPRWERRKAVISVADELRVYDASGGLSVTSWPCSAPAALRAESNSARHGSGTTRLGSSRSIPASTASLELGSKVCP